jgi:hypothetical protein
VTADVGKNMVLSLRLLLIALLPAVVFAGDKEPAALFDKDTPPRAIPRFPSGTEIKNPYTKRTWIVQPDGTLKAEADMPHLEGSLTLHGSRLVFTSANGTEEYESAKAPSIKVIRFISKTATRNGKEINISEMIIELADQVRLTLVDSIAVPVVKVVDGDYVQWKCKKK